MGLTMYSILLLCASIGTISSLPCDGWSDKSFCCEGNGGNYCCDIREKSDFDFDYNDIDPEYALPKIMGVLFGLVFLTILICICCCCFLPCCWLAKRRNRQGQVHRPAAMQLNTQQQPQQPYVMQPS